MEDIVGIQAREGPVDLESLVVDGLVPGAAFGAEFAQTGNAAGAQALAAEEANFDLRLIQPTGMLRSVVDGKATPQCVAFLLPEVPTEGPTRMGAEIIQHKMNGACEGIGASEPLQGLGELGRRSDWAWAR